MELNLSGCPTTGAPIYLKVPYHPNWQATGSDGGPRELLPAGYGMLLLAGEGKTSIQYTPGVTDWVGRALTLLGLALAGALTILNRRYKAA